MPTNVLLSFRNVILLNNELHTFIIVLIVSLALANSDSYLSAIDRILSNSSLRVCSRSSTNFVNAFQGFSSVCAETALSFLFRLERPYTIKITSLFWYYFEMIPSLKIFHFIAKTELSKEDYSVSACSLSSITQLSISQVGVMQNREKQAVRCSSLSQNWRANRLPFGIDSWRANDATEKKERGKWSKAHLLKKKTAHEWRNDSKIDIGLKFGTFRTGLQCILHFFCMRKWN